MILVADGAAARQPAVASVVRSGFAESKHCVSVAVVSADGSPLLAAGEVAVPMFPRSCNKPVQAAAMLRCGLDLDGPLLALAAASHAGEEFHVGGVREILSAAGLTEADLRCPPALPGDTGARQEVLRQGGGPERVYMNCSGKHAGMLAASVAAGWPTESYLDPGHPLQQEVRHLLERLSGDKVTHTGVDGCGAPVFATTLAGLARAFGRLVQAPPGEPERRVADAMRAHPEWMSGTHRPDRALMAALPGMLVKSGAEGVVALALPDGRAVACKAADGASRPLLPVAVAVLRRLGVGGSGDGAAALDRVASAPVLGGGQVVGSVEVRLPL